MFTLHQKGTGNDLVHRMSLLKNAFAAQVSGDMLEDGKYQCNLKDDLAQKLANNLQINLNAYLLYV